MTMLHRTIRFMLLPLFGIPAPALAALDDIGGYARTSWLYAGGWTGVQFEVMSPISRVDSLLVHISLEVKTRDGTMPENVVCSLRRDFRHVPANLHAVSGEDGGLGLAFEALDTFTTIQFVIAWKNEPGQKASPYRAAIQTIESGLGWKRSDEELFGSLHHDNGVKPAQILITGPEDCKLM